LRRAGAAEAPLAWLGMPLEYLAELKPRPFRVLKRPIGHPFQSPETDPSDIYVDPRDDYLECPAVLNAQIWPFIKI